MAQFVSRTEEFSAGGFGEGDDGGVFEAAFEGDGVQAFDQVGDSVDGLQSVVHFGAVLPETYFTASAVRTTRKPA